MGVCAVCSVVNLSRALILRFLHSSRLIAAYVAAALIISSIYCRVTNTAVSTVQRCQTRFFADKASIKLLRTEST